ncbi:CBS domain-containing protein [Streptomyces kunmingensis]|uniref:CBS domain-containing protein n=1 Tax=Streptomyces kunmingensis TaxID=68225 RepID=A0ABU6CDC7_9ACTN|nr:CBS domain-containing protein [Streptomyces kunmingensis]MEB3962698.1 CBS domain-containing protein [Streptomyces kunmingensis]
MSTSPHIVSDVMTHTVVAVGRDAPFKEIVELMRQWNVSALPVQEGEGRVVGVVSEADLLPKEEFRDTDPDRHDQLSRLSDLAKAGAVSAGELMTSPAVCVHADATLAEAARIMAHRKIKRLPVVNAENILEGVVSRSDLLKVFLRSDEDIAEEVSRTVTTYLFPDQPVTVSVTEGVVTFGGALRNRNLVPVAARLARAVEGVVDIRMNFAGPDTEPEPR